MLEKRGDGPAQRFPGGPHRRDGESFIRRLRGAGTTGVCTKQCVLGQDCEIALGAPVRALFRTVDVAPMTEVYPFEKAQEAYDRMLSGKACLRVVLKMDG